jgi:hypothetical protein
MHPLAPPHPTWPVRPVAKRKSLSLRYWKFAQIAFTLKGHGGRDYRLTDVSGQVVRAIIS